MFKKLSVFFALCFGMALAAPAFALETAVSTALTTAFTQLQTDAGAVQALAVPVVIGIMALAIVIRLIKRFMGSV